MKFSSKLEIEADRERVVELFRKPENLSKWQDGFLRVEHVRGSDGGSGSQQKMFYTFRSGEMELLETVTKNDLPDEFSALYQHIHMENTMTSRFVEIDEGRGTLFECEVEYTKFHGIMPRLMATFLPGVFRKQAEKWFEQLKACAETGDA